jgi:TRAP transporter TAXI family solute receptor
VLYTISRPPTPSLTSAPSSTPTSTSTTFTVIRIGTSALGTVGYKIAVFYADVWSRATGIPFEVYPYSRGEVGIKDLCQGGNEIVYISDTQFHDLYNFVGAFKGFRPYVKKMPVLTMAMYTLDVFFLIPASAKDQYHSWSDLRGKPVFLTPAGWAVHIQAQQLLEALNISVNHIEISTSNVAEALKAGTIVAFAGYTSSGGISLAPWISDNELRVDLAVLNPSPEELEKLKAKGFNYIKFNASRVFARNSGMGEIIAFPLYYFWGAAIDLPEDLVYKMLIAIEKNATTLASVAPEFTQLAKNFAGFQAEAVKATYTKLGIPIHPGLAKYLKEKGLWDPSWKVAQSLVPIP